MLRVLRILLTLISRTATSASLALWLFLFASFWYRFDWCTVVTMFPPWCWSGLGIVLAMFAFSRRWTTMLCALWLLFVFAYDDQPLSLIRGAMPPPEVERRLRVVSYNCARNFKSISEVVALKPDIVLVQETPYRSQLDRPLDELLGPETHVCRGHDASIIARGKLTRIKTPTNRNHNYVHARVELKPGEFIDIVSLRMRNCVVRLDLWRPSCWKYYRDNRVSRRRQMQLVAEYVATIPLVNPLIVGGDFNAPPSDAVFWLLEPRLRDAFRVAGRGLGRSFSNRFPLLRIDQIRASEGLVPINVFTVPTEYSDHMIVVADFELPAT